MKPSENFILRGNEDTAPELQGVTFINGDALNSVAETPVKKSDEKKKGGKGNGGKAMLRNGGLVQAEPELKTIKKTSVVVPVNKDELPRSKIPGDHSGVFRKPVK
jgi:hypothetical protein